MSVARSRGGLGLGYPPLLSWYPSLQVALKNVRGKEESHCCVFTSLKIESFHGCKNSGYRRFPFGSGTFQQQVSVFAYKRNMINLEVL